MPSWYMAFSWPVAPLSSAMVAFSGVAAYLVLVFVLLEHMRARGNKPYAISGAVVAAHNLFLSVLSLIMFLGCAYEFSREYVRRDQTIDWYFCDDADLQPVKTSPASGPLFFWSYIYYLSKFYEMLDTIFVILRMSQVPHFRLQVYHHAAVVPMCWLWLETRQSLQFGGLLFNTFTHVVMYYYYALQAWPVKEGGKRRRIWWKKYITKLQIVQFGTSFLCLLGSLWLVFGPARRSCNGFERESWYSIWYNVGFNATLLYAFVGIAQTGAGLAARKEDIKHE